MLRWFHFNPSRLEAEQKIAQEFLTDVDVGVNGTGHAYIKGMLRWQTDYGHQEGPFGVRFVYPHDFPRRRQVPAVYLDTHHDVWEADIDGHVFSNWQLCLFIPIESGIDFTRSDSLRDLIELLPPFLIRQEIYQRDLKAWHNRRDLGDKPTWPGPERSHGLAGLREALDAHGPIGRNAPCLCGSGVPFGDCHMRELEQVRMDQKA